jgi:diguanylate cyclase (GGDEF)-like protein
VGLRLYAGARHLPRSLWLDGVLGLLSVSALGLLVVWPVLGGAEGSQAAVLVNGAYPIADLLLFALCIGVFALHGWRPGRGWAALTLGFALFATADSIYLLRIAADTYTPGSILDSAWVAALVIMSLAAWQPSSTGRTVEIKGLTVLVPPFLCSLIALGVLVTAGFRPVPAAAIVLAGAALLASMIRTALTFRELGRLAEVRRLAATDDLTGLANRRHFDGRLRAALARAHEDHDKLALLVIDLDRFKELNDALGHNAGDQVLAQVGPRLRTALRADDELARLGGDEFAVLLPGARNVDGVARRVRQALEAPFTVDGIDVRIGGSIGVAVFPEHGADAETLLQRADVAMYQAKGSLAGHEFYAPERDRHTRERLELIAELRDAIGTEQVVLHYQPKLDLVTGGVPEVEALVRWQHPTHGLLPPGAFVPLAEQTGVMRSLTDHVLDTALAQCAAWRERGIDVGVAVNVSPATLLDGTWAGSVLDRLERAGVPAARLRIEITEDAIMLDPDRSLAVVRALADAGVGVSVDDFGTGYSSLGLLKQLPVDELKIDRGFVSGSLREPADSAIVQATIDLGRRLGIQVVAEGVEDAATLDRLAEWGAHAAQGLWISRPVPPAELEAWLASRVASRAAAA